MIVMSSKLQELMNKLKVINAETYYHSIHVKSLVSNMIKIMNKEKITSYTSEETDCICKGALLHDIGKLDVKNALLTKDSSLSSEEKNDMSMHTKYGFDIIKNELTDKEYDIVSNICLYHHERITTNHELPLYVQIVSVCDVFDALHSDRIYRNALSYEDAMRIIKQDDSGHFDDILIKYLEKVTCDLKE